MWVQCVSKQLSGNRLAWPVIRTEGYSVVFWLKKLQPYIQGSEFEIISDYKPLKSLCVGIHTNMEHFIGQAY